MLSGWNAVALYLSTEEAAEVAEELGYLFAVVPGMTTEKQFAHYPLYCGTTTIVERR
jgi:hypothetical protein